MINKMESPAPQAGSRERKAEIMLYNEGNESAVYQDLKDRGEELENLLQSPEHSEQEKQDRLLAYLNLLNAERAAELGVEFSERLLERVASAMEAHPTADLAVDQLYACILVQQFHSMNSDMWRAHPSIMRTQNALTMLETDGKWSDCMRYCQETASSYAEACWWPEAVTYAKRAHECVRQLLAQGVTVLENGELIDLRDSAYTVCSYASHTAEGVTDEMVQQFLADLGNEGWSVVAEELAEDKAEMVVADPVEQTPEYLAIRYELEEKIDDALDHERGYYDYCKQYWMAKRLLLKNEYGIRWRSPDVLNPGMEFH